MRLLAVIVLCSAIGIQAQTSRSLLQSDGTIHNTGTIIVRGNAFIKQDSIGGRVEYVRDNPLDSQRVEQMTYVDVHFQGRSVKRLLEPSQNTIAWSLFSSLDTSTIFDLTPQARIEARGTVTHSGLVNPGRRVGTILLNGTADQTISGVGFVPVLELNNPTQAVMTRGGGMRVGERLDLQRGIMQTSVNDNLRMQRNSWIWRSDVGSIAAIPDADTALNVRYYGTARTNGGPELPQDPVVLQQLRQENPGGVVLPWNVAVNDSLILGGSIFTEPSDASRFVLTYTPGFDPRYTSLRPEIDGTFFRTTITPGEFVFMNNGQTAFRFASVADMGGVRAIRLRSKPTTIPEPVPVGADKVRRYMQLSMRDSSDRQAADGTFNAEFGYAWRSDYVEGSEDVTSIETISALVNKVDSLVLLRFDGAEYVPEGVSQMPVRSNPIWRFSVSSGVTRNGDFAIGLSSSVPSYILNARLLLEGAVRSKGDRFAAVMATDLRRRDLIPLTPPREYPFTLDPLSSAIVASAIPDSVVDWIVVELRSNVGGGTSFYRTVLLTQSGYLVDPLNLSPVVITDVTPGDYFLVFRHRNHLAVMTDQRERIERTNRKFLDFTTGTGVFGGANALKLLGIENGRRVFGLVAGDVTADGDVLRPDQALIWNQRDLESYSLYDTDLDGIISTDDWNMSWNNRGRSSAVPR
jgi:hypothetical protein